MEKSLKGKVGEARVKGIYECIAPYLANPRQIKDILTICEGRSVKEAATLVEARMMALTGKDESRTLKTDLSILLAELLRG